MNLYSVQYIAITHRLSEANTQMEQTVIAVTEPQQAGKPLLSLPASLAVLAPGQA